MPTRVLFVCLGNICRSPTAHGMLEFLVVEAGLTDRIEVDSAGTGSWHIGDPPDERSQAAAKRRGLDLSRQRARQVIVADFEAFDFVIARQIFVRHGESSIGKCMGRWSKSLLRSVEARIMNHFCQSVVRWLVRI